ncbi:MAG: hypothetical protein ABJE10_10070 [bacterium]
MMNDERDDVIVRSAFADLRTEDVRSAASFDDVVTRRASMSSRLGASALFRLAAAGIVIAVAVAAYETHARFAKPAPQFIVSRDIIALAAWHPATDALLPASGIRMTPIIGGSILDLDTLTTGALR